MWGNASLREEVMSVHHNMRSFVKNLNAVIVIYSLFRRTLP